MITKAATYNYSGMRLRGVGDRTLVADFTEGDAGFDVDGPIVTLWRVTMLADDLNELVNSDLIKNLNPAPDPKLFGAAKFVRPGRTAWSWETHHLGTSSGDTRRFHFRTANLRGAPQHHDERADSEGCVPHRQNHSARLG
ncbi:glycoside hydrolase family 97 N-terminal domain-containing protein [Stieleria marina]|uniref:glycoside hydrolase family 97 N-terminal domain-containing protein n=1 Tax=Stieleria marina TaxID=1930275 RepID=UPI003AF340F6